MIRLILPSLVTLLCFLSIVWGIYIVIVKKLLKKGEEDLSSILRKICLAITLIAIVTFSIFVLNLASVNEVCREEIDRSALEQGKNNFEEKILQDANKPKINDSTKTK